MSLLEAQNLAKRYKGREVVKDVSLQIRSGEIVGLLGPNGAGKTTCFYMIVGLVQADNGAVKIKGQDISALPMHGRARQGIGYLPQEASIFRKLSVKDNLLAINDCPSNHGLALKARTLFKENSDANNVYISKYILDFIRSN